MQHTFALHCALIPTSQLLTVSVASVPITTKDSLHLAHLLPLLQANTYSPTTTRGGGDHPPLNLYLGDALWPTTTLDTQVSACSRDFKRALQVVPQRA